MNHLAYQLDPIRESARRNVVRLMLTTYVLLVIEGALRKWALEPIQKPLYFIRDPFVLASLLLCLRHRFVAPTLLVSTVLGMAVFGMFTCIYHITVNAMPPLVMMLGWRNYFMYLFFALAMASVLNRDDVRRFITWTMVMVIPMAALAFIQWTSPANAWINKNIGGGEVFTVADGVVRTTGTFTFTAGFVCFTGSVMACLGAAAFIDLPRWLLVVGGAGCMVCLATCGSRSAFVGAALTALAALVSEAFAPLAKQRLIVYLGALVAPLMLIGGMMVFMPQAVELMDKRSRSAAQMENVNERVLSNVISGFTRLDDGGWLGFGIGAGSNGAADSGPRRIGYVEDESSRVVLEGGMILGLGYLLLRFGLTGWMAFQAVRCIRINRDAMPLMLLSFTAPLLMVGQTTSQGTINGYGWIFTGLTMAAIATSASSVVRTHD